MRIDVTQEDIDAPVVGLQCFDCPVAKALKRHLPNKRISVGIAYVHINWGSIDGYEFRHSREVDDFLDLFDNKKPVKPFSFEIPDTFLPIHNKLGAKCN